jgi:hypothetical protein
MATAGQPTSDAVRRAQLMREYWNRVRRPSATALGAVAAFFLAYPPLAQGIYYLLRGLWSLLHLGSVESLAETHRHVWLSEEVGVLVLVIGAALCLAAYRRQGSPEILVIAFGSALGMGLIELIFILHRRISALYLLDVFIQFGLVVFWIYGWRAKERQLAQAARGAQPPASTPATPAMPAAAPIPTTPSPMAQHHAEEEKQLNNICAACGLAGTTAKPQAAGGV